MTDPVKLVPGYSSLRRFAASYRGVLRAEGCSVPVWGCSHDHITVQKALACAAGELDRSWWWRNAVQPQGAPG